MATFQMPVVALVHSRLDYGNAVLVGITAYLQRRLMSVLIAAARLIHRLGFRDHVTDALISLHCLQVPERVKCKVAALTYKVLHNIMRRVKLHHSSVLLTFPVGELYVLPALSARCAEKKPCALIRLHNL